MVGQKVVLLTVVKICDLLSVRVYLLPQTEVEAFKLSLSGNAECDRKCPAFPDVYALDDNK